MAELDRPTGETRLAEGPERVEARDFEARVQRAASDIEVQREARRRVAMQNQRRGEPMVTGLLTDLLDTSDEVRWRIHGLHPAGGVLLVVAHRKSGKTTVLLNLARSYLTGDDFLGEFAVEPIDGRVGFINYEVSPAQFARWAQDAAVPADRFFIMNARGSRNPLATDFDREELVSALRAHEVEILLIDPFARAFGGVGENANDSAQVNAFTGMLDRLALEAGVSEVVLTNHTGWNTGRGRNSTALEDWPDSIMTIEKDKDSEARFVSAIGRDVSLEQDRLEFDARARALRLTGDGGMAELRGARAREVLVGAVVELVTAKPGITSGDLEDALKERGHRFQNGEGSKAARDAADQKLIRITKDGRSNHHYPPGSSF